MSRLIDADDFKKFLQALCKAGAPYEEVVQLLDAQPTAYNVDEVVKEVKEISMKWLGEVRTCNVIKAIRKGGVK